MNLTECQFLLAAGRNSLPHKAVSFLPKWKASLPLHGLVNLTSCFQERFWKLWCIKCINPVDNSKVGLSAPYGLLALYFKEPSKLPAISVTSLDQILSHFQGSWQLEPIPMQEHIDSEYHWHKRHEDAAASQNNLHSFASTGRHGYQHPPRRGSALHVSDSIGRIPVPAVPPLPPPRISSPPNASVEWRQTSTHSPCSGILPGMNVRVTISSM